MENTESRQNRIALKHDYIWKRYNELLENERRESPIKAQFLTISYYAMLIAQDPLIGLSENYIRKIITKYTKHGGK